MEGLTGLLALSGTCGEDEKERRVLNVPELEREMIASDMGRKCHEEVGPRVQRLIATNSK
jgi:hypothetical protein